MDFLYRFFVAVIEIFFFVVRKHIASISVDCINLMILKLLRMSLSLFIVFFSKSVTVMRLTTVSVEYRTQPAVGGKYLRCFVTFTYGKLIIVTDHYYIGQDF